MAVRRQVNVKKRNLAGAAAKARSIPAWWNEVLAVALGAVAVFLLLSALSVRLGRGGLEQGQILFGPVGHFSGTLFWGFMGWSFLVPVLWLGHLAHYFWFLDSNEAPKKPTPLGLKVVGLIGVLISACGLIAIFSGQPGGGRLGLFLSVPLQKYFSTGGATLVTLSFLIISLALATHRSVAVVLKDIWNLAVQIGRFIGLRLPVVAFNLLRLAGQGLIYAFGTARKFLLFVPADNLFEMPPSEQKTESKNQDSETKPLPKPKLRKNELTQVESGDYSHVVVNRRDVEARVAARRLARSQRDAKKAAAITPPEDNPYANWEPPDVSLLTPGEASVESENDDELREMSRQIEAKLKDFGVFGKVTHVHPGPVITLFEFEPAPGVKVGRIAALQDDLSMSLRASSLRIIAPIPRRGTVGIEVPNKHRDIVRLRDVLESESFLNAESILSVALGKDTYGDPVVVDIATMPHLLMAGATGTGKSVCINAVLLSLLYRASPEDLGLILIDPKILELSVYENIPHLRVPVVTHPRQAKAVLQWAANEMDRRYRVMQRFGVRNIDGYNAVVKGGKPPPLSNQVEQEIIDLPEEKVIGSAFGAETEPAEIPKPETQAELDSKAAFAEKLEPLPKIIIVIDELADLMLTVGRDIEELITRLAQKARAAGLHLILATQRPSVDVITGLIKANFPARLSFRVTSRIDSRTILDSMGADKLLGRGDMLFMQPGAEALKRVHGAFVSDSEVQQVVASIKEKCKPRYDERIMDLCQKALEEREEGSEGGGEVGEEEYDAIYDKAVEFVLERGQASTSMIQRVFRIGYNRAARIVDMMEKEGIVGPMDGAKPRDVLVQNPDRQG